MRTRLLVRAAALRIIAHACGFGAEQKPPIPSSDALHNSGFTFRREFDWANDQSRFHRSWLMAQQISMRSFTLDPDDGGRRSSCTTESNTRATERWLGSRASALARLLISYEMRPTK
jgi:hypothetical protein